MAGTLSFEIDTGSRPDLYQEAAFRHRIDNNDRASIGSRNKISVVAHRVVVIFFYGCLLPRIHFGADPARILQHNSINCGSCDSLLTSAS